MNILITGATGQIGSVITEKLIQKGHKVYCLVRPSSNLVLLNELPVTLVYGDLCNYDSLKTAVYNVDAIIHAAGIISYWSRNKKLMEKVNYNGTKNLLTAAVQAQIKRFLFTSSIATIGYLSDGVADEKTAYNWVGMGIDYFDTKYKAEQLVLRQNQIEGMAVNPGIVIGQNDIRKNGSRMLFQIWQQKRPFIPPGATTVSVLKDVAAGHILALEKGKPGERYILGGTYLSFKELYQRIAAVLGKPAPTKMLSEQQVRFISCLQNTFSLFTGKEPIIPPALAKIVTKNRCYSSQKAVAELGYSISPLEEGIRACWDWHQGSL